MSIRTDTFALATAQGRKPGTPGHDDALAYLRCRFADLDLAPYLAAEDWAHSYTARLRNGTRVPLTNLIGVLPGSDRTLAPIIIGAHYDSVIESYCADDNASSVAVMLAAAERLRGTLRRDVVIAAFDAEEPPYFHGSAMGSTRFVEDILGGAHVAIIMDLVGHEVALPGVDPHLSVVTGIESHPNLRGALAGIDLPLLAIDNARVGDMSDHHAFRENGIPFLFLSSGEWEHYHTEDDRPEFLDYAKLERVADAVVRLARHADVVELEVAEPHSIADLESELLEAHLPAAVLDPLRRGKPTREALREVIGGLRVSMWGDHAA